METIARGPWYGAALLTLGGLWLSGCGSELDERSPDIERRQGAALFCDRPDGCCDPAIYESCQTVAKTAPNGYRVAVTTFACRATQSSTTPSQICRVDPTDYLIGGGAFTLGSTAAALTKSLPILGLGGGWSAKSAGISGPVSHGIKTYAIGLQVLDSSFRTVNIGSDIHAYLFAASGGDGNQVGGTLTVPAGTLLIGGGWTAGTGTFAVDAYATGMLGGKWHVNGKQFGSGTALLTGEAIGISRCLPSANPVFCFSGRDIIEATSPDGTFLQGIVANNTHPNQFVVGVGASSSSWSRPIWAMALLGVGELGSPSENGSAAAFTVAPTGDLGHVTTQIMTLGF